MTLDQTFQAAKAGDFTEDKRYKPGEISEATGLQKQPDGSWAPPKTGAKKPLTRADNTILGGQAGRTLNNNLQASGPERDVSAENRAYHEKADKERAERKERADSKASAARQEAEERHLSGPEMKDFFLAKAYEGASVEMTQRGLEAQGFELLEANDDVNVYERPEGGRITMQLEGNKIKSADYKTPAETAAEGRAGNEPKPLPAASSEPDPILSEEDLHSIYMDIKNNELEDFSTEQIQKEYKITRGDAAAIKARIDNNKRAKEQDRRERGSHDAAPKLTGDSKIRIRK